MPPVRKFMGSSNGLLIASLCLKKCRGFLSRFAALHAFLYIHTCVDAAVYASQEQASLSG